MKDTPTTHVEAVDRSGLSYSFRMDWSAKRRILRRVRMLQLRGEMEPDIEKLSVLDNLEFAYITASESRVDSAKLPEDEFLSRFEDEVLVIAAGEIWKRHKGRTEDYPTQPETVDAASQTKKKTTKMQHVSGQDGSHLDLRNLSSGD